MADPAWGTLSMSDEETARALCSFQHTRAPQNQQLHPAPFHQPEAPLYRQRLDSSQEMPQLAPGAQEHTAFAGFGRPMNAVYRNMPMTVRRNETPAPYADIKSPTTSSGDWLHQLQQQQQQQHSIGPSFFQQTPWNDNDYASPAMTLGAASFSGSNRSQSKPRQSIMPKSSAFSGGIQNSTQTKMRVTTIPTAIQARASVNENGEILAPQQVHQWPSSNYQNYQDHGPQSFVTGVARSWEMDSKIPFAQMSMTHAAPYLQQSTSNFIQPPQRVIAPRANECSHPQEAANTNSFIPNRDFLSTIDCRFSSNGDISDVATTESDAFDIEEHHNGSMFSRGRVQTQLPTSVQVQTQTQVQAKMLVEVQTRPPIPPTGAVVVPGMSLAASTRLLTMRDLLNFDDVPINNTVGPWGKRPNGSKQPRLPSKRKAPRKKTPPKRQRVHQQQNAQRFDQPSTNMQAKILSSQNTSLASSDASTSSTKSYNPIYLSFAGSEGARELEQVVGFTRTNPSFPPTSAFAQPQLSVSTKPVTFANRVPNTLSTLVGVKDVNLVKKKRGPYKTKKKLNAHVDIEKTPARTQSAYQQSLNASTIVPPQAVVPECVAPGAKGALFTIATKPIFSSDDQPPNVGKTNVAASVKTNHFDGWDSAKYVDKISMEDAFGMQLSGPIARSPGELVWGESLPPTDVVQRTKSRRRAKAKLPCSKTRASNATEAVQQPPRPLSASIRDPKEATTSAPAGVTLSSVVVAPVVNNHTHVANKTVVIFCKRDFMRYQAAKIWRKYQEQLKKQEEWREVRVAGKRTRYLNSRYDDEVRRTHNRAAHKQNEKLRKRTARTMEDPSNTASSTVVTTCCSPMVNNLESSQIGKLSLTTDADPRTSGVNLPNAKKNHSDATRPTVIQNETAPHVISHGGNKNKSAATISVDLYAVHLNGKSTPLSHGRRSACDD